MRCVSTFQTSFATRKSPSVVKYFADDPATGRARYAGAYFERLGGGGDRPEVAYQITAEDLLAVSMLSVPVVRSAPCTLSVTGAARSAVCFSDPGGCGLGGR